LAKAVRSDAQTPGFLSFECPKCAFVLIEVAKGEARATEDDLVALLKPSPDASLKIWPVGKMVGNVRNNGPHLALPV
jgi:hypothetical protein